MRYTGSLLADFQDTQEFVEADIKDITVLLLQSAENISISRIAAFLAFILKTIRANFCKNDPDVFCQMIRQYIADLLIPKESQTKYFRN